jgi:hypothetical protein
MDQGEDVVFQLNLSNRKDSPLTVSTNQTLILTHLSMLERPKEERIITSGSLTTSRLMLSKVQA